MLCPCVILQSCPLGLVQNHGGSHRKPPAWHWLLCRKHWRGMGVTAPAGLVIRHRPTPSLCASVCIPLARKGLSCLLSPNLAGSLPVGFLVSWDQIREGIPTSLLPCSWKVPPHASHTHPHHLQGCGDNQGRLLLLPQGGGRAHLTWRNISRREDRSIPSGSSMVLDQLKPGSMSRLRLGLGAVLRCPAPALLQECPCTTGLYPHPPSFSKTASWDVSISCYTQPSPQFTTALHSGASRMRAME